MSEYTYTYTLGGGPSQPPGPLARLKAALLLGVMLVVGALVLAAIIGLGLVLLPFALLAGIIAWLVIRRRIRQAIRAMEDPSFGARNDATGRQNVRVRPPAADRPDHSPFGNP